jgi:hypothetical protein
MASPHSKTAAILLTESFFDNPAARGNARHGMGCKPRKDRMAGLSTFPALPHGPYPATVQIMSDITPGIQHRYTIRVWGTIMELCLTANLRYAL